MLAGFFWLIDMRGQRAWAFPLVVVGVNSIAMYLMAETLQPFIASTLKTHFGQNLFAGIYGPIVQSLSVLLVLWLVCLWLYRQRIFIRI
jgi:heparan-alpha-glucosaminide N-acetyltransferase